MPKPLLPTEKMKREVFRESQDQSLPPSRSGFDLAFELILMPPLLESEVMYIGLDMVTLIKPVL